MNTESKRGRDSIKNLLPDLPLLNEISIHLGIVCGLLSSSVACMDVFGVGETYRHRHKEKDRQTERTHTHIHTQKILIPQYTSTS